MRPKKEIPFHISRLDFRKPMLTSIKLDRQFRFVTVEIQNISSNRMLATKLIPRKLSISQPAPHLLLSPRLSTSEVSRTFDTGHNTILVRSELMKSSFSQFLPAGVQSWILCGAIRCQGWAVA